MIPASLSGALAVVVGSASRISGEDLQAAARSLGYQSFDLGVATAPTEVPAADDAVEHAASMIGQGKILANPLAVAVSAASVAAGHTVVPHLLSSQSRPPGPPIEPAAVGPLRAMMRRTVVAGTGTALPAVPGGPALGKTGAAEYGSENPPRTHAWFAGYQGDIAFAALVEDGGFGAESAAPVAARFLTLLAGR